ncbi:hypothetical protein AVEN_80598-1 [Araneus ventricosus]|uniref:Uncharacterized protein n=1 Tax=Araneus ventricosus TaxID=182803 RepID=A0A4Y2M240_ARAVE|nr:hypothetical protein AVEN_80598-1 [Araneus ventricosus]
MSEGMVRKWVRALKDSLTDVHDEERVGRPSVITENLAKKIDGKVRENRLFTISSLSNELPQVPRSVLHGIVTEHLDYHGLFSKHDEEKTQFRANQSKHGNPSGHNDQLGVVKDTPIGVYSGVGFHAVRTVTIKRIFSGIGFRTWNPPAPKPRPCHWATEAFPCISRVAYLGEMDV